MNSVDGWPKEDMILLVSIMLVCWLTTAKLLLIFQAYQITPLDRYRLSFHEFVGEVGDAPDGGCANLGRATEPKAPTVWDA